MEYHNKNYSDRSFWDKLLKYGKKAGSKVVYVALLLYYVLQKPDVPFWAKSKIVGALAYLIMPIDAIPDVIAFAGFGDDLGVLLLALATVSKYVDSQVKDAATAKVNQWFGNMETESLKQL
jgi:uncharacterized membrane protein YkvA (DUF1232 family)